MLLRFALYSFGGWLLESVIWQKPHWSWVWGGKKIPLLPIYGVGGLALEAISPKVKSQPLPVRFIAYSAALTGIELAGCKASEAVFGGRQWDYNGKCIDLPHSLQWGVIGLAIEGLQRQVR